MKLKLKIVFGLSLCIALFMLLLQGLATKESVHSSAMTGETIPKFALPDLYDSKNIITDSLFYKKGFTEGQTDPSKRLTLLNIWASWCSVCKKEHEFLQQLKSQGIDIIGLNYRDNQIDARNELNQTGNPYRKVIFDHQAVLSLELGVYGTPTTFLINADGKILHRYIGGLDKKLWQSQFSIFYNDVN